MNLRESMKDTFLRGVVIGLAAGAIKDLLDALTLIFHVKKYQFLYYSGVMALNRPPEGGWEIAYAQALELIFCGFLGFLYVCILRVVKTRYKILLGIFYGSMVWFTIKEAINAFGIKYLYKRLSFTQSSLIWALSMLFGLLLGWFDHCLEKRTGMIERQANQAGNAADSPRPRVGP